MKPCALVFCLFSLLVPLSTHPACAGQEEGVVVIKISPADQRALIQVPGGKTLVVKPGDTLPGMGRITEITHGRISCVLAGDQGRETVIIRTDAKGQTVSRVASVPEKRPALLAPVAARSQLKKTAQKK